MKNSNCTVRKEDWGYVLYDKTHDKIWRFSKEEYSKLDLQTDISSCVRDSFYGTQLISPEADLKAPLSVSWMTTNGCNSKCLHCRADSGKAYEGELSLTESLHMLEAIKELGVLRVVISGGEPLVRKNIVEILNKTAELDLNVVLSTNGFALKKLFAANVYPNFIEVSLDHPNVAKNDVFRGLPGGTAIVLENLRELKRRGIKFRIMTTLSRFNYDEMENLSELVYSLGATHHEYLRLIPTGRAVNLTKEYSLSDDEYHTARERVISLANKYRGKMALDCFSEGSNFDFNHCYFLIDPKGGVYTFDTHKNDNVLVGNIREKSLEDIWNSGGFNRRAHLDYWTVSNFI